MDEQALRLLICTNQRLSQPSCGGSGAGAIRSLLEAALAKSGIDTPVEELKCFGRCEEGPVVRIAPGERFFTRVEASTVDEIVAELVRLERERAATQPKRGDRNR